MKMKHSEKYIFEGNRCLVCSAFLPFDGHGDDCLVPELVQLETRNAELKREIDGLKNNLRVIQTVNDELRDTAGSLRKLAHDYIVAYEKLAFGDVLLTAEKP